MAQRTRRNDRAEWQVDAAELDAYSKWEYHDVEGFVATEKIAQGIFDSVEDQSLQLRYQVTRWIEVTDIVDEVGKLVTHLADSRHDEVDEVVVDDRSGSRARDASRRSFVSSGERPW